MIGTIPANSTEMNDAPSQAWVDRYLALLGIEAELPSLAALETMVRAHFARVRFENITSILRSAGAPGGPVPPLDPEAILANWEDRCGGGVCYEVATMFSRWLGGLGYETSLALGQISISGGHLAIVVTLDERQYMVDMGCGAPLFEPIPLDREFEVHRARLGYRFRASDEPGIWLQERFEHGEWKTHCRYTLAPSAPEDRNGPYQHHHRPNASWVTADPRLVRCAEDAVSKLTEHEYERYTADGKHVQPVGDRDEFMRIAAEQFDLPNLPWNDALRAREWIASESQS